MKTKKIVVEFEIDTDVNEESLENLIKNIIEKYFCARKIDVRVYNK